MTFLACCYLYVASAMMATVGKKRKRQKGRWHSRKKRQASSCGNDDYIDDDQTPEPEPPEPKAMDLDIAEVGYQRRCHASQANSSVFITEQLEWRVPERPISTTCKSWLSPQFKTQNTIVKIQTKAR